MNTPNRIQVLAFMEPVRCEVSGDIIFFRPYSFMVQKNNENGVLYEKGKFSELKQPLNQKKIKDVLMIYSRAPNPILDPERLKDHPFCQRASMTGKNFFVFLTENSGAPENKADVWIRHFLVSMRITPPNFWNLDGQFGILPNIAWFPKGKVVLAKLSNEYLFENKDSPSSVDKFPRMTDWFIPSEVRIANTSRVRLGAYVGNGTTIMHEGFINFNAGSEGPNMIEGRISPGVIVGADSDLGGGCSTMGTLSGGGDVKVSVGKKCLIGANAGTGIPLGDNCTVEAGLYITAGTKVRYYNNESPSVVKAISLSGKDGLLFRRCSETGKVECFDKPNQVTLNQELHSN